MLRAALTCAAASAAVAASAPPYACFIVATAAFNRSAAPYRKDLFGVYQTPLVASADVLAASLPLLADAGVPHVRYELGLGKPDAFAFDAVAGTPSALTFDWTRLDGFFRGIAAAGASLLLAFTYDPLPLQTCSTWQCWKDAPGNASLWAASILGAYHAHLNGPGGAFSGGGAAFEVWNEPDLPGDGGKVFFNGNQTAYAALCAAVSAYGAGAGAGVAPLAFGGPAVAYDLSYAAGLLAPPPALPLPPAFLSIHAYGGVAASRLQALAGAWLQAGAPPPAPPLFLTEFNSYTAFSPQGANNRFPAAAAFVRDALALNDWQYAGGGGGGGGGGGRRGGSSGGSSGGGGNGGAGPASPPALSRVYWAQWVDDTLGMLTPVNHSGGSSSSSSGGGSSSSGSSGPAAVTLHRKALYNAYMLWQVLLPLTPLVVQDACAPSAASVHAIAAADERVGVWIWDDGSGGGGGGVVNVTVTGIAPGVQEACELRIDATHASYVDAPDADDALSCVQRWPVDAGAGVLAWSGQLDAGATAFLAFMAPPPPPPARAPGRAPRPWDGVAP
jgi:hypothetical protein